jgi:hypothetical protein
MIELIALVLALAISPLAGFLLRSRFPLWNRGRVWALAALPLPLLIWTVCIVLFVRASTASKEACGVDACGMTMAASMVVALMTIPFFFLCLSLAIAGDWLARRRAKPHDLSDVFE